MSKLTNIVINTEQNKLQFDIESDHTIDLNSFMLYIDEYYNIDNIYEDEDIKHSIVLNSHMCEIRISGNRVTVVNDNISSWNKHLKYVRLVNDDDTIDGLYYSPELMYNAELAMIKKVCNKCLDNKCMQLIMYITFKKQLLESAITLNYHKEAMQLYSDICRILELNVLKSSDNVCQVCKDGCCSIK